MEAFGRDAAQPAGLSYRCRECDRGKCAAYSATPGAVATRVARQVVRSTVFAAAGGACWLCGSGDELDAYRLTGDRVPLAELRAVADEFDADADDPDELIDRHDFVVSCPACVPQPGRLAEQLRQHVDDVTRRFLARLTPPWQNDPRS